MAFKISPCLFACVVLFLAQNSAAKSLVPNCGYACREKDLETEDGYHASGSAISSQFLLPDGSVVTNSKETSISSDGIKQTFHQLKKEADRFVQTGHGAPTLHPHLSTFGNIPNLVSVPVPAAGSYYSSSGSNSHDSYAQQVSKDHDLEKKVIYSLSPGSSNSHYDQFQGQHNAVHHSSNSQLCDVCGVYHTGASGGKSDTTASYNTIVGNVAPAVSSSSSYQKYESASQQKNATQQSSQPILFSNSLKPNTFTTNIIDLNNNNNNQNGQGSETQVNYHESGSGQIKTSERVISQPTYSGGLLYPTKQLIVEVSKPGAGVVSSQNYQKQESSSQVQHSSNPVAAPVPVSVYVQPAAEISLAKQQQEKLEQGFRSPVLLGGVPQNIPLESGQSSYYSSSSSSSSSKTITSSDNGSPVVVHQSAPQKYSSSSGYTSGGSYSSSSQNAPEYYYNGERVHGASSSIYDRVRADSNAETLCPTCQPCVTCTTYVSPVGVPVKNSYGVATSYSSQSSTINGKTTENREAAVAVNDNGKVDSYRVKT